MSEKLQDIKGAIRLSEIISRKIKITRVKSDESLALCPFHTEKTPSFRIYDSTGKYHCFGCKESGDVFDWLNKKHGLNIQQAKEYLGLGTVMNNNEVQKEKPRLIPIMPIPAEAPDCVFPYSPEMIHHYHNEDGELMFHIARYAAREGKKKWFLPMFLSQDMTWQSDNIMPQENRPLYGLEKLPKITGVRIAVAGEKKCDKLQSRLVENATISWSGGDGAFDKSNWLPVKDDIIIYWPDNDPKSIDVQHKLAKVCKKLYVIPIPEGKPINWDCGDAIDEGWTDEQIMALIATKVPYEFPVIEIVQEVTVKGDEDYNFAPLVAFPNIPLNEIGLVGRIAAWIDTTARKPQPKLSIGAAIGIVGVIYGHKVCLESNLRSNIYAMGIAASGTGKDAAKKATSGLMAAAGCSELLGGEPGSSEGLLSSIVEAGGKVLLVVDEVGKMLLSVAAKNAPIHKTLVPTIITKIYSNADDIYKGTQLANRGGKTPRIDIDQPCLCIYGISVEEHVHAALSSTDAIDGFLSRWLIFEGDSKNQKKRKRVARWNEPPSELVQEIVDWNLMTKNSYPRDNDNTNLITPNPIRPHEIPLTEEAEMMLDKYEDFVIETQNKLRQRKDPTESLWTRAEENAAKLALCFHEGNEVTATAAKWAIEIANYSISYMSKVIRQNIADNDQQRDTNKVLKIIRDHGSIKRSALTNKTYWLNKNNRNSIIESLIEGGDIKSDIKDLEKTQMETFFIVEK